MTKPSRTHAGLKPDEPPGRASTLSSPSAPEWGNDEPTLSIATVGEPDDPPTLRRPTLRRGLSLGRYMLLDPLGRGGMGEVYAAYDPDLDRKVAIKVLHAHLAASDAGGGAGWQERLLREAQAMARLSHPNVISIYDVGVSEGRVFLAMEFVVGTTLREWQLRPELDFHEVLSAYTAAGRGLAAAHAASLVHRDFKPDNVLVADDGRIKVMDFGIARTCDADASALALQGARGPVTAPPPPLGSMPAPGRIATTVTQDGTIVGTPGYMAPEQYLAQPADARSDQFAFCVALYRGLYGRPPFAGVTYAETRASVLAGKVRTPPRDAQVPTWVFRVLARGLRARRDERYASMDELLVALSRDPAARWRRVAFGALALVFPAVTTLATHRLSRSESALCAGGAPKVQEIWGPGAQAEAERAFAATGKPYAPTAFRQTKAALDAYLGRWVEAHHEACEATQVRHELTAEVMNARMVCLEGRRREARALVRVLGEADSEVVERATRAVESLPGLEACDDFASLLAAEPPPGDPAARAEVEGVRVGLAEAKAYVGAGKYALGRQMGEALGSRAGELGQNALRAEALELVGRTASATRDWGAAVLALKQAAWAAEAARADEIKARAQVGLVYASGELGAFDEAHDWGAYAAASARRLGSGGVVEASRLSAEGWAYFREGKRDEAIDFLRRSLAEAERSQGLSPEALGLVYNRLGNVLAERRQFDEALSFLKREETLLVRSLGAGHPALVPNLNDTAAILLDHRRFGEAIALLERARGLSNDAGLAPSVFTLANLGEAYEGLGRDAEAFEHYERASRLAESAPSPQAWLVAVLVVRRGRALARFGRVSEAERLCAEGLEGVRRALPADHEFVADALECRAEALLRLGRHREARALAREALPVRQRLANADKLSAAEALLARAM